MRLLQRSNTGEFSLTEDFIGSKPIPPYAILSHTWENGEEVTFRDMMDGTGKDKTGYNKIRFCGEQADRDGYRYFWVDTCAIDKSSSAELQEAINSMFRWYRNAEKCYVYLSDVHYDSSDVHYGSSDRNDECLRRWKPAFKKSRWFTRGWTLQELIAPSSVEFFSKEGAYLGNKQSLEQTVHELTGIAVEALRGRPLSQFKKDERLSWAAKRQTTREEDNAYCLLGIFDIYMPLIYGEGRENALARLQEHVEKRENALAQLDQHGERISEDMILALHNDQRRILLDSLRFDQIDARQMTIKNAHVKTCRWLLAKPEYIDWLDTTKQGEHHGFLWIKGKPGTGKSTLMKFALANARKKMKDRIIISFFFNARGEDIEKSTIGTYQSLLLQLLEQVPTLQCGVDLVGFSSSSIRPNQQWGIESLKLLLEQAIQSLGHSSIVCFIDALDECEEEQVRDMIQFFERVCERSASAGISFQVCFSSRHYPHITIRKGLSLVLEGQEGHSQDIANYLESELTIGKSKIAQQIRSELQEKAAGVFMWVVLVVGILNKEHDRGRIHTLRRRLQEIPGDLHKLFQEILTRDSYNRGELLLCIQWVLFAKQPLTPEQLYFAVLSGVEPEVSEWDPDEVTKDAISLFILDCSKGLAEITTSKNRTVQFIHESVRDFLLKENGLGDVWPNLKSNLQGQSHEQLKKCCLTYMDMDLSALEIPITLPKASSHQAAELRKSANDMFPFLEYAVQNVLHHADLAEGSGIAQGNFILSFPRFSWIKLDNLFEKHEIRRHTEGMNLLYVLGERNLSSLIRAYPSAISCLEVGDERYGPPLFAALATRSEEAFHAFVAAISKDQLPGSSFDEVQAHCYKDRGDQILGRNFQFSNRRSVLSYLAELGNEAIVKWLLSTGKFNVDAKEKNGQTPLSRAAENGHEAVVKLLLSTGKVDVNAKDNYGLTPLSRAAENGQEAVLKLMLSTGKADVSEKGNNNGQTSLSLGAERGHEAVVKLLLSTGKVDVNAKDKDGQTPLSRAAENGHEAVVKLLLSTGKVDVNAKDKDGQTPFWWAARNGHEAVVKLLLSTGKVDVDAKDKDGRTPFSLAAVKGREAVVKLLLSAGKVDVDAKDKDGRTPFLLATISGGEAVVRLLLSAGKVDVDAKDKDGRTPFSWAARIGHETVVKLLLSTGKVDVDAKDKDGRTPLWWAAMNGRKAVVKLLLSTGKVNVNAKDNEYERTPLSWAAEKGHEAVVKLLLSTGKVDVDAKGKEGSTPLLRAAHKGHKAIVKLLLSTGKVNVNAKDNRYEQTPLSLAAEKGHKAVVKLLLSTGKVDVDTKDEEGRTPLSRAADHGYEAITKLLLSTDKVDVDAKDNDGWTPLARAVVLRREAIVKLLLSTGKVDVDAEDMRGRTPLSWASENGPEAIVKLLRAYRLQS
jgi:ankyrin repeat protein